MAPRTLLAVVAIASLTACYSGLDPDELAGLSEGFETSGNEAGGNEAGSSGMSGETNPTTTGDGDGDPDPTTTGDPTTGNPTTTGDGDGDPDPTTTGDGDGDPDPTTTGDPTTSGDGDGDPDPTTTGGGTTGGNQDPLPNNGYCMPVSDWPAEWVAYELEVIDLVNEVRAQGANCGSEGVFGPAGPVVWEAALTCAARVHSKDMADNNYFSHTNLQGNGPGWRMNQAGYNGGGWGENIAAGQQSPQSVINSWLDSDGHCANMLNPSFSELGVGYAFGNGQYGHYWTQNFGS